jgi:hypothetical protein
LGSRLSAKSISRSMIAPLEMRPTVGHAARDLGGFAFGLEPPIASEPLADRVDIAVGAEQRRDQQRAALQALGVAHRRDGDVDAGSLRAEGREGSAVTITAATLPVRSVWPRMLTPRRSSIACSDWRVKGMLLSVSPVPLRPTTRP